MAAEKISQRVRATNVQQRDVAAALVAAQEDLATLRTAFNTLTAKLNADAGVTDTNYATIGTLNLQK